MTAVTHISTELQFNINSLTGFIAEIIIAIQDYPSPVHLPTMRSPYDPICEQRKIFDESETLVNQTTEI